MSITMHSASVPIFVRMLDNLGHWLDKAEAHAKARKFDASVYLNARLAPDMLPFTKQIQIACDAAKFGVARLAGVEAPKFEDNEKDFADLRAAHQEDDRLRAVGPGGTDRRQRGPRCRRAAARLAR